MSPRRALSLLGASAIVAACSSSSSPSAGGWPSDGGGVDGSPGGGDAGPADAGGDGAAIDVSAPDAPGGDGAVAVVDAGTIDAGGGEAGVMQTVEMTFYGWDDNSPPGNAIAYPMNAGYPTVHDAAGGTGTYTDPITFATDKSELPIGTIVYAPVIEKYLVMEDDCGQCDTDWSTNMTWHIDVWMNSNGTEMASALEACEDQWTQSATTIEIDPPPGRTITTNPLFDPSTNTCRTTP